VLPVPVQTLGSGLEYHPSSAAHLPYIKRKLALVVDDIPVAKLHDSSFWFMLMKMQVWPLPTEMRGAKVLYETLLPYLNHKPLFQNMIGEDRQRIEDKRVQAASAAAAAAAGSERVESNDDLVEWSVEARNGDPHHIQLCVQALAYMLRALNIPRVKANYFSSVVFKCQ
jgi:hypothetical protein